MLNFIVSVMKLKIKHILVLTVFLAALTACVKKKTYSKNPEIDYKSFTIINEDTALMVITFSDGDGDIGKLQEDKTNNLFLTYYYFHTDSNKFYAWYDSFNNDTLRTAYTIRKPKDEYTGKSISGEFEILMNGWRPTKNHKRIKYVLYLVDNANNKSNVLTTPEITAP